MNERDFYKSPHPPACTCVRCVERRLRKPAGIWSRLKRIFSRRR